MGCAVVEFEEVAKDAILTDKPDVAAILASFEYQNVIMAKRENGRMKYTCEGKELSDKQLDEFGTICLVTSDNEKFSRMFSQARCKVPNQDVWAKKWEEVTDWNGQEGFLQSMIDCCIPMPVAGLFPMGDASPEFEMYYDHGMPQGMDPGFSNLAQHYRIAPGQLTVVTGIPGHGKSEFLDAMLVKLASSFDSNFALYSPENNPIALHTIKLVEKFVAKPFDAGPTERMRKEDAFKAKAWVNKHFFRIEPERPSIEELLRVARYAVVRHEVSGLVLDPWNQIEHCIPDNLNETQYISLVLTELREFARKHGAHVWVVAHPTKILDDKDTGRKKVPDAYSIAGSAHWFNKADNVLSIYRLFEEGRKWDVEVHVQKIKFKNNGRVGVCCFKYDRPSGCYYPVANDTEY